MNKPVYGRIEKILPKLIENNVRIVGLELSKKFASKIKFYNSYLWLLTYEKMFDMHSHFVKELLSLLREIKINFVIGHHEHLNVIQITREIAEKLEVPSAVVLQLPPFYKDIEKAVKLKLLDEFKISFAPKYRSLLPNYYRSIYANAPTRSIFRDIIREPLVTIPQLCYLKSIAANNLNSIDSVLAVSKSIPYEMGENWVHRTKILQPSVAGDELLTKSYNVKREKRHIMYYARLIPHKGILEVPLIWKAFLKSSNERCNLHIAGRFANPQTEALFKTLTSRLKVESSIKYLGYLNRSTLIQNVASAKAIVYPSHLDANPLVVQESLALGTKVVAYDIPAIRFNYSKNSGVAVVDEFDVNGVAEKLNQSIEDPYMCSKEILPNWEQAVESEIEFAKNLFQ